jgi:F0F1-type ATP synthase delta subunit
MKYSAQSLAKALLRLINENPEEYQKTIKGFIIFCQEKRLMHLFPNFLKYFKLEGKREEDVNTLKILSAIKMDENMTKRIQVSVGAESGDAIELIENDKIIAGFIAYYKNKIIDASLANNLHLLKSKLNNN